MSLDLMRKTIKASVLCSNYWTIERKKRKNWRIEMMASTPRTLRLCTTNVLKKPQIIILGWLGFFSIKTWESRCSIAFRLKQKTKCSILTPSSVLLCVSAIKILQDVYKCQKTQDQPEVYLDQFINRVYNRIN